MSQTQQQKALNQLSLTQALQLIKNQECSAETLISAYYDRVAEREAQVGAWQHLKDKAAFMADYEANKAFYQASPLQGLPVGIKDIIDTASMPTEMGSPIHKGRQPIDDATCVHILQSAGAQVMGKTVTTEFAYFKPGKTHNPKDLNRTPGGSSSGSAAAVADNMVPIALGSQTAASVVRPAAYCGAVGYVGTRGEYSLRGIQPLAQSLDSLGMFANYVEDIQLLRSVILKRPLAADGVEAKPRILLCRGELVGETSDEMAAALNELAERMRAQGAEIIEMDACDLIKRLIDCHHTIMAWEAFRNLNYEAGHPDQMSVPLQELMQMGREMERSVYLGALDQVAKIGHWLWSNPEHAGVDAILAPAAPGVAPEGHASTGQPHMSRPWQALGLPTVTVPGMTDTAGVPLGLQLIGRSRQDDQLLALARWTEGLI